MSSSQTIRRSSTGRVLLASFVVLPLTYACSGGGDATDSAVADTAAAVDTASPGAAAVPSTAEPADAPLSPSDIDAFERGLRAELEAVNKAIADKAAAKSGTDTLSAIMGATEQQTVEAGARAAGLTVDRYRTIVNAISGALAARQGQAMMANMPQPDTSTLTAEQKAQVRKNAEEMKNAFGNPFKELPADVASALEPRAAALDSLRMLVVGTRLKAAQ
ncbi:MAG: hypothetical protein K0S86_738 [Geminicoccaceae bacterium]|nr:hypothetical protein [Geminicoccaceae bacterium]